MSAEATCAICGRTILSGERVHGFVEGSEERSVCELCVARAERLGWGAGGGGGGGGAPARSADAHEGRRRLRRPRMTPPTDQGPPPFERAAARFNSSEAG